MHRIRILIEKEFIQIARDRRALIIMILMPIMFLFVLGYAAVTQVKNIPMAVLDLDRSARSAQLVDRMVASGYFRVVQPVYDDQQLRHALDTNQARVGLVIPAGFAPALLHNEPTSLQLVVDGTDPTTAANAMSAFSAITQAESARIQIETGSRHGSIQPVTKVWYNPELRDMNFTVPGLIGAILLQVTLILTSQAIVRERERGTMERLVSSPLKPYELLLGKLVPYAVIALWDLFIILAFAVWWFDVPIAGSLAALVGVGIVYIVSCLGFGLLISTVSFTQQQAVQMSVLFFLPSMVLSGFIYPLDAMPKVIQVIAYITPLRYFIIVARGIILKGVSALQFWPEMGQMLVLGLVVLTLSIIRFNRRFA